MTDFSCDEGLRGRGWQNRLDYRRLPTEEWPGLRFPVIATARSLRYMSAVLIATFDQPSVAGAVRTRLVKDGFPTDRVELTSRGELGQVALVPVSSLEDKLTAYFRTLLHGAAQPDGDHWASMFQRAVLEGKAVVAVQPRGEVETERALEVLNSASPVDVRGKDLDKQTLEHAATETETPILTWMGKVLAAPGAPDTTGLPKLP